MAPVPHRREWRARPNSPDLVMRVGVDRQFWRCCRIAKISDGARGLTSAPKTAMLDAMSYPGGKRGSGIYQKIINLMPPHEVYIEPFLGGGAVWDMKQRAKLNIGLDLSAAAIVGYEVSAGIIVKQGDGIAFLENYDFRGGELVYCDPPYLMSTRSGKRLYEFEMDDRQHRRLLRWCIEAKNSCSIMISGYASRMYAEALAGWNSIEFESMTRGGYPKMERLWFNFEKPTALHDYRYLGRNFRERERIKRMKQRWTARLDRMPILQRQALLSAIADRRF